MTEQEKLKRLTEENHRLKEERRKEDERWKEETGERLDAVEGAVKGVGDKVDTFLKHQASRDTALQERYAEHHGVLFGTKENPESGMFLQLDRLRTTVKNMTKFGWLILGGIVTLAMSGVGALVWMVWKGTNP